MMDPMTGLNRGFCFVTYTEKEGAQEAVKQVSVSSTKRPICCQSQFPSFNQFGNFFGSAAGQLRNQERQKPEMQHISCQPPTVRRKHSKEQKQRRNTRGIFQNHRYSTPCFRTCSQNVKTIQRSATNRRVRMHVHVLAFAEGVTDVIIYSSPDDSKKKNRGFAFLEYESHKAASLAKRRLSSGRIRVWGCDIIVDWADPIEEPDSDTMAKVCAVITDIDQTWVCITSNALARERFSVCVCVYCIVHFYRSKYYTCGT